jgi:hypothetical protein
MTVTVKQSQTKNRNAVLAGIALAMGIALGIQTVIFTGSGDVEIAHPVEILADNDAGPPSDGGNDDLHSPTIPLPPPIAPIAMAAR